MQRPVLAYDTYDDARRDGRLRGACVVLDSQHRFWSTPVELTLLEVHSQMFRHLCEVLAEPPHPDDVTISTPRAFGNPGTDR
jgi:hypothetical protein